MPLIVCPDCEKKISDRADMCPFCGCPSKYFREANTVENSNVKPDIDNSHEVRKEAKNEIRTIEYVDDVNDSDNIVNSEEKMITFSFDKIVLSYPSNTEKVANLYGKYCFLAKQNSLKYESLYDSAGSMQNVLTTLYSQVVSQLHRTVEQATKDLYSYGIRITPESFIEDHEICFKDKINALFQQYNRIKEEKDDIEYQREVEKASRGKWQGGGFGMKGAIKGAMNAAVLNAGSGLLHSIGDSITKSGDKKYINNKFESIYSSDKNKYIFITAVYDLYIDILNGILTELSFANIFDEKIFGNEKDVNTLFETTIKYEKNHEKLFEGMLRCIKVSPEEICYYEPIVNDLFELNCDIESFLHFWNLDYLYEELEEKYKKNLIGKINNPFILNQCEFAMEICDVEIDEIGVAVRGKVIKGKISEGDNVVLIKGIATPIISTTVFQIRYNDEVVKDANMGKEYLFAMKSSIDYFSENNQMMVNIEAFDTKEYDLYATYKKDDEIFCFSEKCVNSKSAIFVFSKESNFASSRGISFLSSIGEIKKAYGEGCSLDFDIEKDDVYQYGVRNNWNDTNALLEAKKYLVYHIEEEYSIRFYFDELDYLVLVAYLKNIDNSKEKSEEIGNNSCKKVSWNVECFNCHQFIQSNSKFCNYCGSPNPLYTKICPACKKRINKENKFCNYCGYKYKNDTFSLLLDDDDYIWEICVTENKIKGKTTEYSQYEDIDISRNDIISVKCADSVNGIEDDSLMYGFGNYNLRIETNDEIYNFYFEKENDRNELAAFLSE